MTYTLSFHDRDGVRVVPLAGEFDLAVAEPLESFLAAALDASKPVVIDLGQTVYIDSTVLSLLVRQKKSAGDHLAIVVPKGTKLRRIFEITSLDMGLGIAESIADAIRQLGTSILSAGS